jgi:hypothetical protein
MALSPREKFILNALLIAVALLVFNSLLLDYYSSKRRDLSDELATKNSTLVDMESTIEREKQLRRLLVGLNQSMSPDAAAAEEQLLHLFHDWEQQAGLSSDSFERVRTSDDHGFTRLTFQITAGGTMPAVAGLIYRIETAGIPLRIDSAELRPRSTVGDDVQVHLNVSTLCHSNGSTSPDAASLSGAQAAGGLE